MRAHRVVVAVAGMVVAASLLAACGSGRGGPDASAATTTTVAAATTSTTVTPVDQVPAVITVEYVQRVMDALDKVEGNLTRKLYADKLPSPEWRNGLMAIRSGPAFDTAEADYGRDAANSFDN